MAHNDSIGYDGWTFYEPYNYPLVDIFACSLLFIMELLIPLFIATFPNYISIKVKQFFNRAGNQERRISLLQLITVLILNVLVFNLLFFAYLKN